MIGDILYNKKIKFKDKWNKFEKLSWLSVTERRDVYTCEYLFKHVIQKTTLTPTLKPLYLKMPQTRERRKPLNFHKPRTKTKWAESNFQTKSIEMWNSLPNEIQKCSNLKKFLTRTSAGAECKIL